MEPVGCPETSVRNYHYTLRNIPEENSNTSADQVMKILAKGPDARSQIAALRLTLRVI